MASFGGRRWSLSGNRFNHRKVPTENGRSSRALSVNNGRFKETGETGETTRAEAQAFARTFKNLFFGFRFA